MKFIILLTFAYIFGLSQAFWSDCPGGLPGLDSFESPQCTDRCRAVRGEIFTGHILFTTPAVYQQLLSRATAFIFGIGKIVL
jgi:hypothetical protein